jgi:predicted regulator of Ras-like GTPase activity (Roadblock/LC7/MglB family)
MSRVHEAFLQAVNNVPGVNGSYLVNNRGEVLMSLKQQRTTPEADAQLALRLVQMFAALEVVDRTADEITLHFEQGLVTLYMKLGLLLETKFGVEEVFLGVVTTPKANLSMLRMTIKVAATKLKGEPAVRTLTISAQVDRRNLLQRNYLDEAGLEMVKALVRA